MIVNNNGKLSLINTKYKIILLLSSIACMAIRVIFISPVYSRWAEPVNELHSDHTPVVGQTVYKKSSEIFSVSPDDRGHPTFSKKIVSQNTPETAIDSILKKVELIPVSITGNKDNRINIVIMNRWTSKEKEPYNKADMRGIFLQDIRESLIAAFTPGNPKAQTAFANYRNFFNVYALWWPDMPEWGKGVDIAVADSLRNRLFLPWKDEHTGWVTILAMPNVRNGGGGAGRNLEERIGDAVIAGNGIGKMLHEISHTCMSLGDEYTGAEKGVAQFPTYNSTTEYRRDKIKWRKWIDANTPLPTPYREEFDNKVGAFEGNQYHLANYFRSSARGCIMGAGVFDNTEKMCAICEQRVAMRVYSLVNPINSYLPSMNEMIINGDTICHFSIDHIRPEPNTQVVRWILNGKTIATGTDSVKLKLGIISEYELTCSLTDETPFIRPDPPYGQYPQRNIRWLIHNRKPVSVEQDLKIGLQSYQTKGTKSTVIDIRSIVSGGTAPFSYQWSTGDTTAHLNNVAPGIYHLVVTDHAFRKGTGSLSIYEKETVVNSSQKNAKGLPPNSTALTVCKNITASTKNSDNGKISLEVKGGSLPYTFEWADEKKVYTNEMIYEAENASINIPGYAIKNYFGASNQAYVSFNNKEGAVSWKINVARAGIYPVDIIYAGINADNNGKMDASVNGSSKFSVSITSTRPLYTGWEKISFYAQLQAGVNWITLSSVGQSGPNIDYLRVPGSFLSVPNAGKERNNLSPGNYTVLIKDSKNNSVVTSFQINEVDSLKINNPVFVKSGEKSIGIKDPQPEFTYEWYRDDAPSFYEEKFEKPLFTGNTFSPPGPGTYFMGEKNNQTFSASSNRIGVSISKGITGNEQKEIDPSSIKKDILAWLDASDADANGIIDNPTPERGPLLWKDKMNAENRQILVKYLPNELNGKGVGAFDNVWGQSLSKEEIKGFQTIIMVYKESSMSFPGKSPFTALSKYIGKSRNSHKSLFDLDAIDEKTKEGKTYLNGKKVDPFTTPNPLNYCILSVELGSKAADMIRQTDGYWEGSLAELIIINRVLSENERKGIEEYLRKKWFASFDLDF